MLAVVLAVSVLASQSVQDGPPRAVGPTLAQVRRFAGDQGEQLWTGYGRAPFGFLLVTKTEETLLCQSSAPPDFTPLSEDAATGCSRWTRPPSGLPTNLLAAFPLFGQSAVIVMGTPATTGRSPADWTRTILHEHFHQYEMALPNYFERVAALGLAKDKTDGMWMLNFPFPYADPKAGDAFASASVALADALDARGTPGFNSAFDRYLSARKAFAATVSERDWRYLDFELWQEGVARWTEIVLGAQFPDPEVQREAKDLEHRTLAKLRAPDLRAQGRELVYPMGAGEAMLMQSCDPAWRDQYPKELAMTPLLNLVRGACTMRR